MSDELDPTPIIDLSEARKQRIHAIHEARLAQVRAAFEKALPLPKRPSGKAGKNGKKKKPPRR
jgi:hypothetical protein